jgi:predicted porin
MHNLTISFWRGIMKKQLLTTTALVAAGVLTVSGAALADKPKLTVGGSTEQIFGVGNNSDSFDAASGFNRTGFDQHSDGEVHFNGSVTLDNGIKIRTRVELEGNSDNTAVAGTTANGINGAPAAGNTDYIDEHWMRISGSFGEVRLGSGDPAGMAMTTGYLGTWSTNVSLNMAFDSNDWVSKPGTVGPGGMMVNRVDLSSDAEHVSYFTPRFSGFQLGASYIPSAQEDVNNQRASTTVLDSEGWSMGINYVGKFGGVGVGIAAGYATMNESAGAAGNTVGIDDPEVWGIAGRFDFGGFRVSASWVDKNDQSATVGGVGVAGGGAGQEALEVGARYTFGPNAVSIAHMSVENDSQLLAADGDESRSTFISYRRTLGPGVSWHAVAIFAEHDNGAAGAASGTSNDGEALVTSIRISF